LAVDDETYGSEVERGDRGDVMAVCFGTSEILRLKAVTKLGYA